MFIGSYDILDSFECYFLRPQRGMLGQAWLRMLLLSQDRLQGGHLQLIQLYGKFFRSVLRDATTSASGPQW